MSRRIRKHANPFNVTEQVGRIDRMALFGRKAPLEIDVGCGGGGFVFRRAAEVPEADVIGLEIRKPLVEAARAKADRDEVRNVAFFYANANTNVGDMAAPGIIRRFFVQFPDPCFKKRHRKRRILQPALVRTMAELLPLEGEVFLQSDVLPLAQEMYDMMAADGSFDAHGPELDYAKPFSATTEWEEQHERESEPIYRMSFIKKREPLGPIPEFELRDTNPKTLDE